MQLRIATFNLESLDDRPGLEPPLAARVAVLRPQLERLRADVLCLREVNGQHSGRHAPRRLAALDALIEGTRYGGYHRIATEGPRGHGAFDVHNLAILSRFPVLAHAQVRHDLVSPPVYRPATARPAATQAAEVVWDRPILHAQLDLGGGATLHTVNLHLRAPLAAVVAGQKRGPFAWESAGGWAEGFYLAAMKRAGQALEARLLVDRLLDADEGALIAVCGDFNADAREVPVRIIMAREGDTGSGWLAGRVMVPLERAIPPAERFTVVHAGARVMLDHVLVSRALLAWYRGSEVHNEALGDEVAAPQVAARPDSLHAPVVAAFEKP